ncbi:MAG TPA: HD domain-containing protein, partial [Methanoregulaceae archaeon]|nr:HD domain-containing protein [Methanoregulaceae archaeon]
ADRDLLVSAGLLHDIGWSGGRRAHHRRSCEMIRSDRNLPFEEPDRTIVALVARYHRRSLPDPDRHPVYGALDEADRARTRWLGGMLRLADWLDHDHEQLVADLRCDIDTDVITVRCRVRRPVVEIVSEMVTRADLLEEVGGRRYRIVWERD